MKTKNKKKPVKISRERLEEIVKANVELSGPWDGCYLRLGNMHESKLWAIINVCNVLDPMLDKRGKLEWLTMRPENPIKMKPAEMLKHAKQYMTEYHKVYG